jgi:hypothetical protein
VRRVARSALSLGLLGAALLAGYIGGDDVLSAVAGKEQDSPGLVLILVGASFLIAGGLLAKLALISVGVHAGAPIAVLVSLVAVPWWHAFGPAGGLVNAALLIAVMAVRLPWRRRRTRHRAGRGR